MGWWGREVDAGQHWYIWISLVKLMVLTAKLVNFLVAYTYSSIFDSSHKLIDNVLDDDLRFHYLEGDNYMGTLLSQI